MQIQFFIIAGEERFRNITKSFYKGAHGLVLCFDMNDESSFDFVKGAAKQIYEDNFPFVFCSNNGEYSKVNNVEEKIKNYGGKIFYFNDKNKKGIDDGIGWLTDKFTK